MNPPDLRAEVEEIVLVIKRKTGQRILVGETWITVLRITGGQVRLGFEGPEQVVREELTEKDYQSTKETNDGDR